jgi:hypothetical protein
MCCGTECHVLWHRVPCAVGQSAMYCGTECHVLWDRVPCAVGQSAMFLGYFVVKCVSCTVVVLTGFVMCGCVCMCGFCNV